MLFDEFESLGNFEPAVDAILRGRSSFIKCWFILQNSSQLDIYGNIDNFWENCDVQVFGISKLGKDIKERITEGLGSYDDGSNHYDDNGKKESTPLMSISGMNDFLNAENNHQLFIPVHGASMRLNRVPFVKFFGNPLEKISNL